MQVPANRDNPAVGVFSSGTLAPTRVECAEKPCAGEFPIALYGDGGYTENIGDFLLSQSGEEAQFYNLGGPRLQLRQLLQGFLDGQEIFVPRLGPSLRRGERYSDVLAAPFFGAVSARVVDQDPAERLRCHGEEVGPILPRNRLGRSKEPEVQLVDEGRGLQRVVGAFLPEIIAGQQPQLAV